MRFSVVGPPGPSPIFHTADNQHSKKSHRKNDCDFHCEMFDSKNMIDSHLIQT